MYYLNSRYYDPVVGRFISADIPEMIVLSLITGELLETNFFVYCYNTPVNRIDPKGHASYKNTVTKTGSYWEVKTIINILWTSLTYNYIISWDGVIRFDFTKNDYWSVLWRSGAKTLAEAMFKAARSLNNIYLKGRTIGGIHTELLLHWVMWITTGISNAKIADMGSMIKVILKSKVLNGFDNNAWVWEGANAAKILAKLNIWNVWGFASLIRDIARYF